MLKIDWKCGSMSAVLAATNFLFLLFLLLFMADFFLLYIFLGAFLEMAERILEWKSISGEGGMLLLDMDWIAVTTGDVMML